MAIVEIDSLKTKFEPGDNPGRQDYLNLIDTLAATPDISGKQDIVSGVSSTEIGYLDGVTSAIQTQLDAKASQANLDLKAALSSPTLLGTPLAPTATAGTNTTQIATTAFVKTAVDGVIASAPGALDTLNELATALGNDASFATTITNSLAGKVSISGGSTITASGAGVIPVIAKGAASQTANLFETQDSSGTVQTRIAANGTLFATQVLVNRYVTDYNNVTPYLDFNSNKLTVNARNASYVGLVVQGATSQTANLQEWQNSAGTVLTSVDSAGALKISPTAALGYALIDIPMPSGHAYPGVLTRSGSAWITALNPTGLDSYWQARFQPQNTTTVPLYVKGAASQTANLQEWQNSAGTVNAYVTVNGDIYSRIIYAGNAADYNAIVNVNALVSTRVGLIVRGAASQTANLQEWQNSAGTVLSNIRPDGTVAAPYFDNPAGSGSYLQSNAGNSIDIVARVVGQTTFRVKGAASQTAPLQEWQDSAGTVLSRIESNGSAYFITLQNSSGQNVLRAESSRNLTILTGGVGSFGGGGGVLFVANAATVPTTNPAGGGIMYVEGGALKFRGSSGTVTTIANA